MPVDVGNPLGKVRLLIADMTEGNFIFPDDNIQAFLDIQGQDIFAAAANALEVMAANEVMVLKRIRLLDLQTDGPEVSRELRQLAKTYREQSEYDEDAGFEIANLGADEFTQRTLAWNYYGVTG